jgi:hypothetical protein
MVETTEYETPLAELFAQDPLKKTLTPEEVARVVEKYRQASALFLAGAKPERKKRASAPDPTLLDF